MIMQRWALSYRISSGAHARLQPMLLGADATPRSMLPDYVFDSGEKQKTALKRSNTKVSRSG